MPSLADILNASILVVDDNEANIRLLEGMLRIGGYTSVHSTTDSTEVCELHRTNRYNLILLDLQMPGMDGFEVMKALHEIEPDGGVPVLVITAQPAHKLHALEAGAKDFLSKPFDMAELRARVHNLLEVRLLHLKLTACNQALEATVRELEASREVIRLKTLEEKKKSEQELCLAQETQESLLPRVLPQFQNFHIHAFNHPTRYVGGDFYDFLELRSGEWMGVLADVSGKGISAALLSSMVLGALSMDFRPTPQVSGAAPPHVGQVPDLPVRPVGQVPDLLAVGQVSDLPVVTQIPDLPAPLPHEVLNRLNQLLYEKSLPFQFVTLFLFVLNPDGAGQFISAGHNPAYLFRAATGKIEHLVPDHFVLGMFNFASYQSRAFHLDTGDILVVYSDGLTDAENPRQEMFGDERLLEIIQREAPSGSQAVEQSFLKAIDDFTQGTPQTDDITFVIVEKCQ